MLTLYPDQSEIMSELRQAMHSYKKILLQSPTGSGKTAMATDMIRGAVAKGKRMLFSVPRRDLLEQTSLTFNRYGVNHSFVAAGKDFNPFANIFIGMVPTMVKRIDHLPKVDVVIIDEARYGEDGLTKVINHYEAQGAWVIGLDATPWKMNGVGLGVWFDYMVKGKSIQWLIDNKRLSDYRYFYGRTQEDFHALTKKTDKEIAEFMEKKRVIIGDCVHDYKLRCMGKLHIVRCTSVLHSQITAQAFRDAGINAVHVDGETPDKERSRIFRAFALREISVLTFAELLSFGFDLSQASGGIDVCIESASDLKPSKSLAGQMQFWGRALRYKPYPAIFNDHVNNYLEHGLPCSEREWTLESRKRRIGGEKVPPTRQCPGCWFVHPPAPKCPQCGVVYEIDSRIIKEVKGELSEIDKEKARVTKKMELAAANSLDDLIAFAIKNGYKNPKRWAGFRYRLRQQRRMQNALITPSE